MKVIVPHGIDAEPAGLDRQQMLAALWLVLCDHDDSSRLRGCADALCELGEQMRRAGVEDRLRGVETKAVEMKLTNPVTRIADDEVARALVVFLIQIERLTPVGLVTAAEVIWTETVQIIAIGPE